MRLRIPAQQLPIISSYTITCCKKQLRYKLRTIAGIYVETGPADVARFAGAQEYDYRGHISGFEPGQAHEGAWAGHGGGFFGRGRRGRVRAVVLVGFLEADFVHSHVRGYQARTRAFTLI